MTLKIVSTAAEAIEILGGKDFVGDWWGIGRTGMLDMIRRNRISTGYKLQAYVALRDKGYEAAPQVFGLKSWDHFKPPLRIRRSRKTSGMNRRNGARPAA